MDGIAFMRRLGGQEVLLIDDDPFADSPVDHGLRLAAREGVEAENFQSVVGQLVRGADGLPLAAEVRLVLRTAQSSLWERALVWQHGWS
jgi:hypothetical protein